MKHHSIKQQMYQDLRKAYTETVRNSNINQDYVPRRVIVESVIERPAPRFYINSQQASAYVLGYYRGDPYVMRYRRRDMIEALVKRYEALRKKHPYAPQSIIWELLVESPAPKFYVTVAHATAVIFNYTHYKDNGKSNR